MPMNRIRLQPGLSLSDVFERYGSEVQREAELMALRWPEGFCCPRCASAEHEVAGHGRRRLFQCRACRHQTSLTAGTLLDSTKPPLRTWFLEICQVSQGNTGLPSLALKRQLGTSYRSAWLGHQKRMAAAMAPRDSLQPLQGSVQIDDAYLGGESPGTSGCSSPNKVAVQTYELGYAMRLKASPVASFTHHAIARWARAKLLPGCDVCSDGLTCFAAVIGAGCAHSYIVVGSRKPRELPQLACINTVLANLKTMINGGHKAFKFRKYASQYLGAFAYWFNARVDLLRLLQDLLGHAATASSTPERTIRGLAEVHD